MPEGRFLGSPAMPPHYAIDLSAQTRHHRYQILRREGRAIWFIGFEECLPTYRIDRPQGFQFPILELIVGGRGEVRLAGRPFPLTPGTAFVYGPGLPVSFEAGAAPLTKYFISALSAEAWQKSWFAQLPAGHPYVVPGALAGPTLLEPILASGAPSRLEADALGENLLTGFGAWLLAAGRSFTDPAKPDLLQRAFQVLEAEFKRLGSVAAWADRIEVSPSHLCRVFKEHHHKSPYAELTDRKLQHAHRRLSERSVRVQDVAREVGYEDPFHFSRLFKRRMGFPPSQLL